MSEGIDGLFQAQPRHFVYTARMAGIAISEALKHNHFNPSSIPTGILLDLTRLFRLLTADKTDKDAYPPINLALANSCWQMAAPIYKGAVCQSRPRQHETFDKWLSKARQFIEKLGTEDEVAPNEQEIGLDLKKFFARLIELGEAEVYERAMGHNQEPEPIELR